jgi:hypothetical protein
LAGRAAGAFDDGNAAVAGFAGSSIADPLRWNTRVNSPGSDAGGLSD